MRQLLQKFFAVALSLLLVACVSITAPAPTTNEAAPAEPTTLTVFAAASLTEAFTEIGQNFSAANPGVEVTFNFAGSQQLAQQIGQGAPVDVFASANANQMNVAIDTGRIITGTQHTFVRNRLVVVTPADNPGEVAALSDLSKAGLKIVLAAKEVPVGQYALDFLDKAEADGSLGAGYKDAVIANVVSYEENVRAVLAKVTLGEADAGIVYSSDISQAASTQVQRIDIPDNLNTVASYPIAPLSDSPHAEAAQHFIDYVMAPEGQQVLVNYGFISTTGDASGAAPGALPVEVTGLVDTPTTFSADDLKALDQVTVKVTDRDGVEQEYSGVPLSTIWTKVGVQAAAQSVVFIGGDGYSKEVTLAELNADPDAMITVDESGALRNIIPTLRPGNWVKGLVQLEVK